MKFSFERGCPIDMYVPTEVTEIISTKSNNGTRKNIDIGQSVIFEILETSNSTELTTIYYNLRV